MTSECRAGVVAVIGAPNAGKSTLVNALVGQKVSIVTHKVQTTRFQVRGVMMRGPSQVVLVDTPGIFAPRERLDRAMVRAAWDGAAGADAVLHVVDAAGEIEAQGKSGGAAKKSSEDTARVVAGLRDSFPASQAGTAILALNKIDLIPRDTLLALAASFHAEGVYADVFMIAATRGDGVTDLADYLASSAPPGPWLYPAEQAADMPLRLLAAEITREKVFLRLHKELPYRSTVETESWEEFDNGSAKVQQILYVERDSQRQIALGKGGRTIKAIGQAAREELAGVLGRPVHLFLHVKVRQGWREDRARYSALGLDFGA